MSDLSNAQRSAFEINGGFTAAQLSNLLIGAVFVILLLWGVWAMRVAYNDWVTGQMTARQFFTLLIRFVALYIVLTFLLLS